VLNKITNERLSEHKSFRHDLDALFHQKNLHHIPSEPTYSRLVTKLADSNILEKVQEQLIVQAIKEGFIIDNTVAIDAIHFEARDKAPTKKKEEAPKQPKKRGRKSKAERDQWLQEQAEIEANKSIYEKKIVDQLDTDLSELRSEVPRDPEWVIKKNSEGKSEFWYGYKGHLSVGATS